jgi:hypothetical protein
MINYYKIKIKKNLKKPLTYSELKNLLNISCGLLSYYLKILKSNNEIKSNEEIRNNLIVTDPKDRGLFTKEQCKLINGIPFNEGDQDKVEDVLSISPEEMKFWESTNGNPNHIYDFAEKGWENLLNKSETFTN